MTKVSHQSHANDEKENVDWSNAKIVSVAWLENYLGKTKWMNGLSRPLDVASNISAAHISTETIFGAFIFFG